MKTVVLLMYHGQGHLNAIYKVARLLQQKNLRVVIAAHEFFHREVLFQGFESWPLKTVPFALGFENWVNTMEKRKFLYLHAIRDRIQNRLFKLRRTELGKMIDGLSPDVVLIDSWQSTDYVVLHPVARERNIALSFIQTMCSTSVDPDHPMINEFVMPGDQAGMQKGFARFRRQRLIRSFIDAIKYFGNSNGKMLLTAMRRNGVDKRTMEYNSLFSPGFRGVIEYVLSARAFDLSAPLTTKKYLGFLPSIDRKEHEDALFQKDFETVLKNRGEHGGLIYCSFGTVNLPDAKPTRPFLLKLLNVVKKNNWTAIISGVDVVKESLPLTENVFVFRKVPQLKVLREASVFISHGGLNSIKEAIHFSVPILIYPIIENTDHPGNAARVVHHKLGLHGDITADDSELIESKIKELQQNPIYKGNLKKMAEEDRHNEQAFTEVMFSSLK